MRARGRRGALRSRRCSLEGDLGWIAAIDRLIEALDHNIKLPLRDLDAPPLLVRVEYAYRAANQPYFSGNGGITGPNGVATDAERASFRPDLRATDDRAIANITLRM